MSELFTKYNAWKGGFYELDLELPDPSEFIMKNALTQLWAYSYLEGCFLRSDVEPANQEQVSPLTGDHEGHLFGIATHLNHKKSCCGSFGGNYQDGGSWMTFYIPFGSLADVYPVGAFPFYSEYDPPSENWLKELNSFMVGIARFIYQETRFKIGIIGYEVDQFEVLKNLTKGIPSERWNGILIPRDDQLEWVPPTIYKAPFTIN